MRFAPRNDPEYSRQQLERILSRRRLRFNPYLVSDERLLEYAWHGQWGQKEDLTQMVIMTFTRVDEPNSFGEYSGIYFRVGLSQEELFLSRSALIYPVAAHDTLHATRHLYGKSPIRHDEDILHLVGKTVFVSRTIHGFRPRERYGVAYKMHRLVGKLAKDATVIREAMCTAKIEMLERLLAYPESPWHLDCEKGLIDYETPIRALMNRIRLYPQTPVPSDS